MKQRTATEIRTSQEVTDGNGVRIKRSIGLAGENRVDPFLLLDEFVSDDVADYIGGFPEPPHRGVETVTYMLGGNMKHRDHLGNEGLLVGGGAQWMTAGRGVLHSEMPEQIEGKMHGFQLWVNLPAKEKMIDANYQEFNPDSIPTVALSEKSKAKILAGRFENKEKIIEGPVKKVSTQPDYFDILLAANEIHKFSIPSAINSFIYVYDGELFVISGKDESKIGKQQYTLLSEGDFVEIKTTSPVRFLIIAGEPINEPVVQWGPFVMNTMEEIEQALKDYRNGVLV